VPGREADGHALVSKTVVGLENHDETSSEYRAFKQLVERLNRTYKFHTRPRAGFKSFDEACALTTLFVAYYNHLRPHSAIGNEVPVPLPELAGPDRRITMSDIFQFFKEQCTESPQAFIFSWNFDTA
jgi:hypothetical protein